MARGGDCDRNVGDQRDVQSVVDHSAHTRFSDPGAHADLVAGLHAHPAELSAVARNVIVHYRASGHELPEATRHEINSRWLERMLDADQSRHPTSLAEPREPTDRVQGCCRDHTLFCVAALRAHGVPARSRVGYAGYFTDGWHHDHVIVEAWLDGRWQRFDAELEDPMTGVPDQLDMALAEAGSRGFVTAADAWATFSRGELDAETHGVDPDVPLIRGPRFLFDEVIHEVAHRFGDELLLWDAWGRMSVPGTPVSDDDAAWIDDVARLLLAADGGDLEAEQRLLDRYRGDDGLHPGTTILQASPFGDPPAEVSLA